jgi:DMSO reductase anchor subunit
MLTLTQLAVGAFIVDLVLGRVLGTLAGRGLGFTNALFALALALAAMGASSLHLGRPQYAFRAVLGLRTSWMSREIVTLGLFAFAGLAYAGCLALGRVEWAARLAAVAAGAGVAGVVCSVMVYAATRRDHWRGSLTGLKFGMTTLLLGLATVMMVSTVSTVVARLAHPDSAPPFWTTPAFRELGLALALASAIKLGFELSILRHIHDRHHSVLKRSALLMVRDLRRVTLARFICGALGGVLLPVLAVLLIAPRVSAAAAPLLGALTVAIFLLSLAGELSERYLFFSAAPSSKMPGALG